MRKSILKITSLILVLCAILGFSSCKEESDDETSTDIEISDSTDEIEESSNDVIDETDESNSSTQADDTTDETSTEKEDNTPTQVKMPETKEEIAKYYADAVNKVKSSAKSVVKVYTNTINYQDIVEIGNNSTLSGIAQSLMGQFLKEDTKRTEYSTQSDYEVFFPPKKSTTCKLTADMIDTAECKDLGSEYEIKIKMNSSMSNPDVNPPMGGGKVGTTFNIVDIQEITDAAGSLVSLEGVKNSYFDASLVCRIDKATGNMTHLEQILPSTMEFSKATAAIIITVNNPKIGLEYHEHWEINW